MSNVGKRGKLKLESRLLDAYRKGTGTRLQPHEVQRVRAALSAPAPQGIGREWQTIETAPDARNWTRALVWSAKWAESHIVEKRSEDGRFWLGDWDYELLDPTHWQPLPEPPAQGETRP